MKSSPKSSWYCAQLGAREHYAVPRALHRSGKLSLLCTDFWAEPAVRQAARFLPLRGLQTLASRHHPDLRRSSGAKVCSWNLRALNWEARLRRASQENDSSGSFSGFVEVGQEFAVAVRQELKRRRDWSPESIFFGYDTGALETLAWLRERGAPCVVDQMDPNRVEVEVVREEEKRWPGWAKSLMDVPASYFKRREQEWALASRIVVNSEFCRDGLIQQGVPSAKLTVIPLCYESPALPFKKNGLAAKERKAGSPLKVLWLGQVILRKGIHYLIQAARLLSDENIEFDVVGPIGITDEAIQSAPPNVTFHGPVPRNQASAWYQQADLFVLPTLSDGFGLTQVEAMAHGLPVIATSHCGKVVTEGSDGFVVPARNAEALARAILRYQTEPALLREQQPAAFKKAGQFTMAHLASDLNRLEAELRK